MISAARRLPRDESGVDGDGDLDILGPQLQRRRGVGCGRSHHRHDPGLRSGGEHVGIGKLDGPDRSPTHRVGVGLGLGHSIVDRPAAQVSLVLESCGVGDVPPDTANLDARRPTRR